MTAPGRGQETVRRKSGFFVHSFLRKIKPCHGSGFGDFWNVFMPDHVSSIPDPSPSGRERVQRARSLPNSRPFRVAVFFASIHYLCLIASATAFGAFLTKPSAAASHILVAGIALSAISWLIAFFKRRSVSCPLCKGTPLINSGACTHSRARRLPPLNHGTTAILSILATQKFRCMYCASNYDLLKPPTRLLRGTDPWQQIHAPDQEDRS